MNSNATDEWTRAREGGGHGGRGERRQEGTGVEIVPGCLEAAHVSRKKAE